MIKNFTGIIATNDGYRDYYKWCSGGEILEHLSYQNVLEYINTDIEVLFEDKLYSIDKFYEEI